MEEAEIRALFDQACAAGPLTTVEYVLREEIGDQYRWIVSRAVNDAYPPLRQCKPLLTVPEFGLEGEWIFRQAEAAGAVSCSFYLRRVVFAVTGPWGKDDRQNAIETLSSEIDLEQDWPEFLSGRVEIIPEHWPEFQAAYEQLVRTGILAQDTAARCPFGSALYTVETARYLARELLRDSIAFAEPERGCRVFHCGLPESVPLLHAAYVASCSTDRDFLRAFARNLPGGEEAWQRDQRCQELELWSRAGVSNREIARRWVEKGYYATFDAAHTMVKRWRRALES